MDSHALETYRSMVTISVEALKTLLLLNGGALVAIGSKVDFRRKAPMPLALERPTIFFVVGLAFCAAAFWTSYATQLALFNEGQGRRPAVRHGTLMVITASIALVSLGCFAAGALTAIFSLR